MSEQKLTRSERSALAQLTTAIFLGETEKALTLIVPGLPLDAVSGDHDQTPLMAAIETGNQPVFDALLAAGASPVAPNPMGETPLHAAASKARDLFVRALVARGADVNSRISRKGHQYDGRTPLMDAACANNLAVIKILLELGADPFLKDASGMAALSFAEIFGKRVANHLRKVMSVSPAASDLGLHDAARAGIVDRVRALLDSGTAVDAPARDGRTALQCAAGSGHANVVRFLVDRGGNVNAIDPRGYCALSLADNAPDVVRVLLEAGADPNIDLGRGHTAFHAIATFGSRDVVSLLIDAGANLQARTADGRTPLECAQSNSHAVRKLLKDRLGLPAGPLDDVYAELKRLVELARSSAFEATANRLGTLLHRKASPWRRRKGVAYFHNVSIAKYLSPHCDESSVPRASTDQIFLLLARLQDEILAEGFTLVYADSIPAEGRLPLILLPTPNKYVAVLASGTNGINKGHDTEAVIAWLMEMELENPFVLAGCGHDFLDGRFARPVKNAHALAERMIAFCPDMVDQAEASIRRLSRPEQSQALARDLSESGWFSFWWD